MANLYVEYNGLVMGPKDDPSGKCGGGCTIRTPFVSRAERWEYVGGIKSHRVSDISMSGKIFADISNLDAPKTGNEDKAWDSIEAQRTSIINAFSEDYKELKAGNYTFSYVKVNDVTFSPGNTGVVEFSISLTSHEQFFADTGITEPKNEYTFKEGEDGVLNLTHNISARASAGAGIDADGDADRDENDPVAKAKSWCESLTGLTSNPTSMHQADWTSFTGNPFSISHTYDRISGTYSIQETWRQGKYSQAGYVENYEINEKYSTNDEYTTIQINYSIKGPPGTSDATMQSKAPSVSSFYNKIKEKHIDGTGGIYGLVHDDAQNNVSPFTTAIIDPTPKTYEIKQNKNEGSINITIEFNQLKISNARHWETTVTQDDWTITAQNYYYHAATNGYAFIDWDVSVNEDTITDVTTVDINATMKSKGPISVRKARTTAWLASLQSVTKDARYLYAWAGYAYGAFAAVGGQDDDRVFPQSEHWNLSPDASSLTIEKNNTSGEIRLSASFSNKDKYMVTQGDLQQAGFPATQNLYWRELSFDINQKCALNVMSMKSGKNGDSILPDWLIFDHNTLSKETTTFTIRGVVEEYIHGAVSFGNGGRHIVDTALGVMMNSLQVGWLQNPLNNDVNYRGLESNDSTKSRKGLGNFGTEFGNYVSKTVSVSQTVPAPFMNQDGKGKLGIYDSDGNYIGERP